MHNETRFLSGKLIVTVSTEEQINYKSFWQALLLLAVPDDDQLAEAAAIQDILQVAIQGAIAGYPIVHKVQEFDEFDPNISQKRRKQFYEVFGIIFVPCL